MSWHCLPELAAEYWAENCLDGEPSPPSKSKITVEECYLPVSATDCCRPFQFGTTCAIDIFIYQRKIGAWTKNTDTAKSATALYAGSHSSHETKGACNNAAQTIVAGLFRQRRLPALARSAECNFFHLDLNTKPVPVHAGRCCGSLAERSIRWLKSESALLSSVAR